MSELRVTGIGQVLRELREDAGLSIRELAEQLGWNQGTLSRYETNQSGVSFDVLDEIADELHCAREALAIRCLMERYRCLQDTDKPVGELAQRLVREFGK